MSFHACCEISCDVLTDLNASRLRLIGLLDCWVVGLLDKFVIKHQSSINLNRRFEWRIIDSLYREPFPNHITSRYDFLRKSLEATKWNVGLLGNIIERLKHRNSFT